MRRSALSIGRPPHLSPSRVSSAFRASAPWASRSWAAVWPALTMPPERARLSLVRVLSQGRNACSTDRSLTACGGGLGLRGCLGPLCRQPSQAGGGRVLGRTLAASRRGCCCCCRCCCGRGGGCRLLANTAVVIQMNATTIVVDGMENLMARLNRTVLAQDKKGWFDWHNRRAMWVGVTC